MKKYLPIALPIALAIGLLSFGIARAATTIPWTRSGTNEYPLYLGDRVGIGSSTPAAKLSVHDNSGGIATSTFLFSIASSSAAGLGTTTLFSVLGNGNVGIATTTPAGTLVVAGTIGINTPTIPSAALEVDTTPTPNTTVIGTYILNKTTGNLAGTSIRLGYSNNSASTAGISGYFNNLPTGTPNLGFLLGATQVGDWDSIGFGIGSTSPYARLVVNGNSGTTDDLFVLASSSNARYVTVSSLGNFGIGSSSPIAQLSVVSTAAAQKALIVQGAVSQTANLQEWQDSNGVMRSTIDKNGNLIFSDGFVDGFYWGDTGKAGIAFTGSGEGLALVSYSSIYPVLTLKGRSGQTANLQQWSLNGTLSDVVASNGFFGLGSTTPGSRLSIHDLSGAVGTTTLFAIASSTSTGTATTTLFVVQGNGNVGVGVPSPLFPITVTTPDGTTGITIAGNGGSAGSGGALEFNYNAANLAGNNRIARILGNTESGGGGGLLFQTASAGNAAFATKVALTRAGNFGVGTTTPVAKLDVYGTAGTADIFAISSSSNARLLTVTSAGNVGIGTSTPGFPLVVTGTTTSPCFSSDNGATCISGSGGSGTVNSGTAGQIPFYATNGTALTATSNIYLATSTGYFGINSATPLTPLWVHVGSGQNFVARTTGSALQIGSLADDANSYTQTNLEGNPLILNFNSGANVGVGTTTPDRRLSVNGSFLAATTTLTNLVGTGGKFLAVDNSGNVIATSSPSGSGTVTSVGLTAPTGLSVSGSPVTTTGTLALSLTAGYVIPLTASTTDWQTAFTNRITSLTNTGTGVATLAANVLNIPLYAATTTSNTWANTQTFTNAPIFSSLTGVLKGNGASALTVAANGTDYTLVSAQNCTNQVITALTASGGSTCSTVSNAMLANSAISGVALGGTLGALTATNSTLTFSGSYTGAAAQTIGINLANANTWTGITVFTATSTQATTSISQLGVGTTSTAYKLDLDGGTGNIFRILANATTAIVSVVGSTLTGLGTWDLSGATVKIHTYPAFTYATSTAWTTGTTTIPLGPAYVAETWTGVKCFTDAGTVLVSFYDGTNRMNPIQASTTVQANTLSTNNTFAANTKRYVDIGTPSGTTQKVSCTVDKIVNQ